MKREILFLSAIVICIFLSCNSIEEKVCKYNLYMLEANDTPSINITYKNDTLIEVKDNVKDTSSLGLYTFDRKRNLRFYAFLINQSQYRYSEEYDSLGHLIQKEGTPLLEYRLFKGKNDSVIFNASLFSLNKKYREIEVVTNVHDTIYPQYLFKSNLYTNVKCFSFKLPVVKNIDDLVIYTKGIIINTCTQKSEIFNDTTLFKGIKL